MVEIGSFLRLLERYNPCISNVLTKIYEVMHRREIMELTMWGHDELRMDIFDHRFKYREEGEIRVTLYFNLSKDSIRWDSDVNWCSNHINSIKWWRFFNLNYNLTRDDVRMRYSGNVPLPKHVTYLDPPDFYKFLINYTQFEHRAFFEHHNRVWEEDEA